jgi:formyl-CoA transferase
VDGRGGPLAGVRVVELGRYISAPFAGRLLADLGADVIKVEAPDGDPMRWLPVGQRQSSPQFASYNRGKRSVTLDLKDDSARQVLAALVGSADVLVHNMRADALTRVGLDEDRLTAEHPALVVCAISGYGPAGDYAGTQGYDVVVAGLSGFYSQFLDLDHPELVGPSLTDLVTGLFAVQSVLAALLWRSRSGRGQRVGISMLESVLNIINDAVATHAETGRGPDHASRQQRQHAFACLAGDGKAFVVHLSEVPARWEAFLDVLGRPAWGADPAFATYPSRCAHFDDLAIRVNAEVATRPRAQWLAALRERDLACGPINSLAEALAEPQVHATGALTEVPDVDGPITMVRPTGTFSASPLPPPSATPPPGQDLPDLLRELGVADEVAAPVLAAWRARRTAR